MADKRERARDMAEEGLDRLVEGDEKGRELIEKAKKLDPDAVAELAEEVERDREQAERFTGEQRLSAAGRSRMRPIPAAGSRTGRLRRRFRPQEQPLKGRRMTPETFRRWLADRGCDFERHPREKSGGVPSVTVRRDGRKAGDSGRGFYQHGSRPRGGAPDRRGARPGLARIAGPGSLFRKFREAEPCGAGLSPG